MADASDTLVGGRYRLGELLGEGGFGTVYAGVDTQLRRPVAVKLLDPEAAARGSKRARSLRDRFRREAVATAAIDHPNVVTIYDIGVAGEGDVYIVMELLDGWPLAEELHQLRHGLSPPRMLPHFVACLEGLGVGHRSGIVHKDLKPGNLFLVDPRTPKESMRVIDFGVARVLHEQKLTATGRIVGTPRYLAPEYIEEHRVSPALDVYQMALILVETLSGAPCIPRGLDLVDCCQRHLVGDLRIPDALLRGEFGEVLRVATAADPDARFADGIEFSEALASIDPETVHPTRSSEEKETPRLGVSKVRPSALASVERYESASITVEDPASEDATTLERPTPDIVESAPPTEAMVTGDEDFRHYGSSRFRFGLGAGALAVVAILAWFAVNTSLESEPSPVSPPTDTRTSESEPVSKATPEDETNEIVEPLAAAAPVPDAGAKPAAPAAKVRTGTASDVENERVARPQPAVARESVVEKPTAEKSADDKTSDTKTNDPKTSGPKTSDRKTVARKRSSEKPVTESLNTDGPDADKPVTEKPAEEKRPTEEPDAGMLILE